MPAVRYFRVVQTREVKVTALNQIDAIKIASRAFINGQNSDNGVVDGPANTWGNTNSAVREVEIHSYEES